MGRGLWLFADCNYGRLIDLSDAYYHIQLHQDSRKYVAFCWNKQYYQFCGLTISIHSARYVFTKVTRTLLRFWRSKNIRVMGYMEDFPSADQDRLTQLLNIRFMYEHLISLGWLTQMQKIKGLNMPCTILQALGTIISF